MNTFQRKYYLYDATAWQRLKRDLRLLGYIAHIIWLWLVVGGRVRRQYKRAEKSGQVFYLDFLDEEEL